MCSVLEVCVDSTASALAAKRGGADRLELCADLIVGGTTPSLTLVQQVKAETGLPVRALLRPRFGDFCYDSYELAQMEQLAAELVEAGADGIVTGVLTPEGALDADAMRPIYAAARKAAEKAGRPVVCTLHRAFDVCADPFAALETAREMGLCTILTSGQAASAWLTAWLSGSDTTGLVPMIQTALTSPRPMAANSSTAVSPGVCASRSVPQKRATRERSSGSKFMCAAS